LRYYPHTENDIQKMLAEIGETSLENLFSSIPSELKQTNQKVSEKGMWEQELKRELLENTFAPSGIRLNFAGAGCYEHFIPSVVDHLTSRSEFFTAYTPYQPEASQGTLQSIFEYQSLMCEMTGMDVSNASHYDGATALSEAVLMSLRQKKGVVIVPENLHPRYRDVLKTYPRSYFFWKDLPCAKQGLFRIFPEALLFLSS